MHEMIHWAAGGRHPIVMGDVNRAMAPGWSIWTDQNDSLSERDTGWMQYYCSSNQEVLDTVNPGLQGLGSPDDTFHGHPGRLRPVPTLMKWWTYRTRRWSIHISRLSSRSTSWTPKDPRAFGALTSPEHYFELRYKLQKDMEKAPEMILKTGQEFEKTFGRKLGLIDEYMTDDADLIFVTSGTPAMTVRLTIDELRKQGIKGGQRQGPPFSGPFPFEAVRKALQKAKKVAVVDRNISYGCHGIFFQEVKSALYGQDKAPLIHGYITGLGGRDITTRTF